MKTCSTCKRQLSFEAFPKNKSKLDGLGHSCKQCHRLFTKQHYKNNKEVYVKKADKNTKRLQAEIRKLKEIPCFDCKETYPYYVMDFDHVRGKKLFNLSKAKLSGRVKAHEEAQKCDVVCANCHRIRTHKRKNKKMPLSANG